MTYINPFHLLATTEEGQLTSAQLKLAKKRYLAEFELTGATTIDLNGQEMDKNDVLNFFEELSNEKYLQFHQKIFHHKPLLNFLEQGSLNFFLKETEPDFWLDRDFVKFIGSYFSTQFGSILLQAIKQHKTEVVEQLFNIPFPLQNPYKNDAYKPTHRYYHREIMELEDYGKQLKEAVFVAHSELINYIHPNTISLLNQLPSYFETVRSMYAIALQKLAIQLHNDYRRTDLARDLLEGGLYLSLDKHTANQLEFILNQLGGKRSTDPNQLGKERSTEGGIFSSKSWSIIFYFVLMGLFLFLKEGCSSTNDTVSFKNLPTIEPVYQKFNIMESVIDSLEAHQEKLFKISKNKTILDSLIQENNLKLKLIIENNKVD